MFGEVGTRRPEARLARGARVCELVEICLCNVVLEGVELKSAEGRLD